MLQQHALQQAAAWLREARQVVVFTGAGISAESGIPTFRDSGGFWERFPAETFASWGGLIRTIFIRPLDVCRFVEGFLEPVAVAQPNAGHLAVAEFERHVSTTVVTQNVDRLHQEAGSSVVREVHGSLFDVVTPRGRLLRQLSRRELQDIVQRVKRIRRRPLALSRLLRAVRPLFGPSLGGWKRPNIVLFGDALCEPDWTLAQDAAIECDVMVVVGTSGLVWPAAGLPAEAKANGARVIDLDPHKPGEGDVWLQGTAAEVLPQLVAALP